MLNLGCSQLVRVATALAALGICPFSVHAATWNGAGTDNLLSNGANWMGGVAPPTSPSSGALRGTENVVFAGTTRLTPDAAGGFYPADVTFDNTAGSFLIGNNTTSDFVPGFNKIDRDYLFTNNSTATQTVDTNWFGIRRGVINAAAGDIVLEVDFAVGNGGVQDEAVVTVTGAHDVFFNGGIVGKGTSSGTATFRGGILKIDTTGGTVYAAESPISALNSNAAGRWNGKVEIFNGALRIRSGFSLGDGTVGNNGNTQIMGGTANSGRLEVGGIGSDAALASAEKLVLWARSDAAASAPHIKNVALSNTLSGAITLDSNDASTEWTIESAGGAGTTLTLSGAITNAETDTRSLNLVGANDGLVSGNLLKTGAGTFNLNKRGAGTWTISGAGNTFNGTTAIDEGVLAIGASEVLPNATALNVNGGTFDLGGLTETVAAVTLSSGSITAGDLTGDSYELQSGTVNANLGGTGSATKSTAGTVTLAGNNTFSGNLFFIDNGTLNLTGSHNTGSGAYVVGFDAGTDATVNISGDLTIGSEGALPDYAMEIGTMGTSTVNQTAGTVTTGGTWGLIAIADDSVDGIGAYNLKGGVLDVAAGDIGAIFAGPGTASFGFTGGTLKVKIFNPTGSPFLSGSGFVQGGLTQNNTDGASLLDVTTNDTAIFGNYNLLGGRVEIGAAQSLTVSEDVALASGSTWDVQFDGDLESVGLLSVAGVLDIEGAILNLIDAGLGAELDGLSYLIAEAAGGINGTPTVTGEIPLGYFVNIGSNQITLQAVPEPGCVVLIGMAVLGLSVFRRRHSK